jgi:hypothetical protein
MVIILHVTIALLGLAQATYGLFSPSLGKIKLTYALTAATFASGTYLVWQLHTSIVQSCMSGLAYLGFIIAATLATRYRLAKQTNL